MTLTKFLDISAKLRKPVFTHLYSFCLKNAENFLFFIFEQPRERRIYLSTDMQKREILENYETARTGTGTAIRDFHRK